MKVGEHTVDLKNVNKIVFPDQNITKGDLIDYYEKISDYLLPYLKNRPLTLSRFPDGIEGNGFYQEKVPDYFPDWIQVREIEKLQGGAVPRVICNNKATLIYLVNEDALSFQPWLSTTDHLNKPDRIVFDLDPPRGKFDMVVRGAKALRRLLEGKLNLKVYVMATGSKGLHVVCPIMPEHGFCRVHSFAKKICKKLADLQPNLYTTELQKEKRGGRLFLDYLRNYFGQTSIPPYSVRALKGAPIATPLNWDELDNVELTSQSYNLRNIYKRIAKINTVWKDFNNAAQTLDGKFGHFTTPIFTN